MERPKVLKCTNYFRNTIKQKINHRSHKCGFMPINQYIIYCEVSTRRTLLISTLNTKRILNTILGKRILNILIILAII